ncbi:PTS fructose transporter subunit IIABC [Lactobacillus curvatus]|nr:PTS fructose transporter subunit IIABC [Latilactobacillus curvatus]MSE24008.1 PTS fructose transporter subunit IIABC [Latilactobacillus curvatus]
MTKYQIIAATGCPTGIAHTYMAQEALEQAAQKQGVSIKVETHGQSGTENVLTDTEIKNATGVIIAADKDVDIDRFAGKRLINVSVSKGMKEPDKLVDRILNDDTVPIYHGTGNSSISSENSAETSSGFWHTLYVYLMNGVSHMLPLVVAGGVLTALSFFWGINSADPKSSEYNQFAQLLNTIGGFAMNLMVPVLCAYIAEAIGKRSGLIVGFATGMIAYTNGTGFLGGILGGFLAGYTVVLLQILFKKIPKSLDGLKQIFLFPVLGVFASGAIMWYLSVPMKTINEGMMTFLKGMENSSPLLLGIVVGIMCASDMGGPINKAAYLTGTALLAQGNYFFMAGVSAACIAPPLATGFAVLFNKKAYSSKERSAGYVNFLLGSTHITEGAIPFAAKNPLLNLPAFMVGSAIAATLTYISRISVPAPHGGFIVLPLVNKPFLWVLYIVIGSIASGLLLAIIAGRQTKKTALATETAILSETLPEQPSVAKTDLSDILSPENIRTNVAVSNRDELLDYLAHFAKERHITTDEQAVLNKYHQRESEGSTGMEKGIAIPHAEDAAIQQSAMLILKLSQPIAWETFDHQPVDTIISFLIPDKKNNHHLQYLSSTSKLLMHKDFIQQLKATNDPNEIFTLFKTNHS